MRSWTLILSTLAVASEAYSILPYFDFEYRRLFLAVLNFTGSNNCLVHSIIL